MSDDITTLRAIRPRRLTRTAVEDPRRPGVDRDQGPTGTGGTGEHGTWTVRKGTIGVFSVRLAAAFVDQPGRRP
jgi:hypothetical protein